MVPMGADLSIKGCPYAFAIGELCLANFPYTGKPVPGVATFAVQMGRHAADVLKAEVSGNPVGRSKPFRFRNMGMMATIGRIGRRRAVVEIMPFGFAACFHFSEIMNFLFTCPILLCSRSPGLGRGHTGSSP